MMNLNLIQRKEREVPNPVVLDWGMFAIKVCVPHEWTPAEVMAFAESRQQAGTNGGWRVLKDGDPRLGEGKQGCACPERAWARHWVLGV